MYYINFSPKSLVAPITPIGLTALSVLIKINFFTLELTEDFAIFFVPIIFTLIASTGFDSHLSTCFKAAA